MKIPFAEYANAHPLAASVGVLAGETGVLALLAPASQLIYVLAIMAGFFAVVLSFPLFFKSFVRDVLALDDGIRKGEAERDRRLKALEVWRIAMNCEGCGAKTERLEQIAADLREVRELPPIAAALRTHTTVPPTAGIAGKE
jgi:hypothetical protein